MLKEHAFVTFFMLCCLGLIVHPVIRAWHWGENEFALFELSRQLEQNNTDFYQWLGVEPTATTVDIGKAHRSLVLKLHPDVTPNSAHQFDITNQVAHFLRSPASRDLYDQILRDGLPLWKGFHYLYTRYKLYCMIVFICLVSGLLEYLKAWDGYMTEKLAVDHFVTNARTMAQQLSDRHVSASSHRSFIDLGDRSVQCEVTAEKEIFIMTEKGERVPLDSAHLVQRPSVLNVTLLRIPLVCIKRMLA